MGIWQIQRSKGLIRCWCKECKNFRPCKCFGGMFFATKCLTRRDVMTERYGKSVECLDVQGQAF